MERQPPRPGACGSARVPEEAVGERLDRFAQGCLPERTRTAVQRLIEGGRVRLNDGPAKAGTRLRLSDQVTWEVPDEPPPLPAAPEAIPLEVIYEDADLLVIAKPKGMVVHPAPGNRRGTLVNALLGRAGTTLAGASAAERPGIVHRLDKNTSGLLVIARNDAAYQSLQAQIQRRTAERRYLAVLRGSPKFEQARVEAPIGRDPRDRKRMAVIPPGSAATARAAVTHLEVRRRYPGFALLEALLETGRTHQIRVHCAYIGLPVVGDQVYGPSRPRDAAAPPAVRAAIQALQGQALHAYRLAFDHPRTGERQSFEAPLPEDVGRLVGALEKA